MIYSYWILKYWSYHALFFLDIYFINLFGEHLGFKANCAWGLVPLLQLGLSHFRYWGKTPLKIIWFVPVLPVAVVLSFSFVPLASLVVG